MTAPTRIWQHITARFQMWACKGVNSAKKSRLGADQASQACQPELGVVAFIPSTKPDGDHEHADLDPIDKRRAQVLIPSAANY